jgi:hypothetical protein
MRAVIDTLSETYRDDGIAIWLAAEHKTGRLKGFRPIELCTTVEGRAKVLAVAESLTGMVAT